jgi:hypothetical protein
MYFVDHLDKLYQSGDDEVSALRKSLLAKRRVELGEIETSAHGRVQVALDRDNDAISIHGINSSLSELENGLRQAFIDSAANLNASQVSQEQASARAVVSLIVDRILRADASLNERVKQRAHAVRFGV